jgi:ATP-dependent RNA helicase DeaD
MSFCIDLVRTLQHDLDIVTIAQFLSTYVLKETSVSGREKIGLSLEEIERPIEHARNDRGGHNGRKRNGGGYNRNRR